MRPPFSASRLQVSAGLPGREGAHPPGTERFAPRRDLLLPSVLAVEEGAHTPWGNFLLVQKVTKNTLRGSTPKNPSFGNRVVEGFI